MTIPKTRSGPRRVIKKIVRWGTPKQLQIYLQEKKQFKRKICA